MVQLYLVRHGEAESGGSDVQRRLNDKGRAEVEEAARGLLSRSISPDQIWHSHLRRAIETSAILAKQLKLKSVQAFAKEGLAPGDEIDLIYDEWCHGGVDSLLIVGHMPFLANLAAQILKGKISNELLAIGTADILALEGGNYKSMELSWKMSPFRNSR